MHSGSITVKLLGLRSVCQQENLAWGQRNGRQPLHKLLSYRRIEFRRRCLSAFISVSFEYSARRVKRDYCSGTLANVQHLKVSKAAEERRAQTTFSLKVALMLVKVTWRDNAVGSWGWYCAVLNLRKKKVYPQVIILMSPQPLFFFTVQWLQYCSRFTGSGNESGWHSTPVAIYVVRCDWFVTIFLQP